MKKNELVVAILLLTGIGCVSGRAQTTAEKQGWHLSMQSYTFHLYSVMESLDKTQELGIGFIEVYPGQKLGEGFNDETFGYHLDKKQMKKIREAASARNIKIISSGVWTAKREEWEKIFSFAKDMGMEFITAEPAHEDWDVVENLAKKYRVKVAVHNHPSEQSYWNPEILLKDIGKRSNLLGACADVGHYKRMNLDPVACLKELEGRIISLHFKDIAPQGKDGTLEDVVWGKGILNVKGMMEELKRQDFKGYFTIEYEADWENNLPQIKESTEYFNRVANDIL